MLYYMSFFLGLNFSIEQLIQLYLPCRHSDGLLVLRLYVDDIVLTGDNPTLLESFITTLVKEVAMTNEGSLHFFLESGSV